MNPLISIVVPIYNAELYLRECIDSILQQTYENLEVILVDDGSTDNSPAICDEYALNNVCVQVTHKKNGGASSARNVGLSLAKGEWIGFVDSDDYIAPEMYETLLKAAEEHHADIVCCDLYKVYGDVIVRDKPEAHDKLYYPEEAMDALLFNYMVGEAPWDKMYRKSLFAGLPFREGEINEDLVIMPELIRRSERIWYCGSPFYFYRQSENSVSRSGYSEKCSVIPKHMAYIDTYVRKYFPALIRDNACFQTRYAMGSMRELQIDPKLKQRFEEDYRAYQTTLRKYYFKTLTNRKLSVRHKVRGAMMLLGIFGPYVRIRRKIIGR